MKMINKHFAFTLAEVLITLGIVGMVAEMTIPTLINNTQDKTYQVAAKKAYAVLSQATMSMVNDNSGSIWDNSVADSTQLSLNMKDAYKKYFNTIKEGTVSDVTTIGWYGYKNTAVVFDAGGNATRYILVLSDGSILRFWSGQNCSSATVVAGLSSCGSIFVDVNGTKKPNMIGKDAFDFNIDKDSNGNYKVLPSGIDNDGYTCTVKASDGTQCFGCTEMVLNGQALP